MYLRHKIVRARNGEQASYWTLVRSVRRAGKVVQETVANLGRLDEQAAHEATALAEKFLGQDAARPQPFEDTSKPSAAHVEVDQVRVEKCRTFGNVWLGWLLWKSLQLDQFCETHLARGREEVAWGQIAAILTIARLCEPSSELHIAEDFYRRTALEELVGVPVESVHHTRLYRGLDQLLEHKRALEVHIKDRLGALFSLNCDLLLYDVTSTYFEGEAKLNPMAKRGYSRDGRPDCKQVCIGLVVTRDGFPLGYELFDGNRVDVSTVEDIVGEMEERYGKAGRIWVMDRGMTSAHNLEWLRQGGRRYLIGTPRSEMKKWQRELIDRDGWRSIRDGLEVKLCQGPDGAETFILCRSDDRATKEKAMHERFAVRIRARLESLERRIASSKSVDRVQVERQIGRVFGENSRAAGKFTASLVDAPENPSGLRLDWRERDEWNDWAQLSEGTYILRTNVNEWTERELWETYIQLTQAEAAFRIQKSDLRIRPVWHQKEDRVKTHILVCFLAFAMWKTLEGWQSRAGLGNSPRTILEELGRIQVVDVVLPLRHGPELRLRCIAKPDQAQAALLDRLGLELPRRLRVAPALGACSGKNGA